MFHIFGRNPVIEAIRQKKEIQKIYIQHNSKGDKVGTIYRLAKQNQIPVSQVDLKKIKVMVGNVVHQGVVALISPIKITPLENLLFNFNNDKMPGCFIIVDRIHDPHNMGAIIRSAEVFKAKGVIYAKRENVPITETVIKASAGAAFHIPICQTGNLVHTIEKLKKNQIWIFGSSLNAKSNLWDLEFRKKCAIIIGNEEKGIRPLLEKKCDDLFTILHPGKTESLNASVAAGIILAEIFRQNHITPN